MSTKTAGTSRGLGDVEVSSGLDEAFERMAGAGFELPNGFVNHGAMACEALAELGFDDHLDAWSRRFSSTAGNGVEPVLPKNFEWREALGDYRQLPEWIGVFEAEIEEEGWPQVVDLWVPRLLPGLSTALFHGVIRVAHATRAIASMETPPRRNELARALGYWAARFRVAVETAQLSSPAVAVSPVSTAVTEEGDVHRGILDAAAGAARVYVRSPSIYYLHGVTGAMAVEILVGHMSRSAGVAGLAQIRAEHAVIYAGCEETQAPGESAIAGASESDLAEVAADSSDPHQVKLVEACRRGSRLTKDSVFAVAAETVTGMLA